LHHEVIVVTKTTLKGCPESVRFCQKSKEIFVVITSSCSAGSTKHTVQNWHRGNLSEETFTSSANEPFTFHELHMI